MCAGAAGLIDTKGDCYSAQQSGSAGHPVQGTQCPALLSTVGRCALLGSGLRSGSLHIGGLVQRAMPSFTDCILFSVDIPQCRLQPGAGAEVRVHARPCGGPLSKCEVRCLDTLSSLFHGQEEAARRPAHLGLSQGTANKHDDALPLVLVLAMLQRQLRDLRAGTEVGFPLDLQAGHAVQYFPKVRRGRHQNGRLLARHGEHPHLHTRVWHRCMKTISKTYQHHPAAEATAEGQEDEMIRVEKHMAAKS